MAQIKKINKNKYGYGCSHPWTFLYTVSGSVSWYNHFGKLALFTKVESMHTL